MMINIIRNGFLNIFKWAIENNFHWDKWICAAKTVDKYPHIFNWIKEDHNVRIFGWDENLECASNKWISEENYLVNEYF